MIGAIAGAVAGIRFGVAALPECWLDPIDELETIEELARDLHELNR